MNILLYISITLFLLICLFMILLILIQKGRGGGLSSAFGGAGGNTAFGSKTGDVLTWVTSVVFGLFLILAVTLNLLGDHVNAKALGGAPAQPAQQTQPARTGTATDPEPLAPGLGQQPVENAAPAPAAPATTPAAQ